MLNINEYIIRKGNTGKKVKKLQYQLNAVLGTKLSIDGDFGTGTELAVKKWQEKFKFDPTGIMTLPLLLHLREAAQHQFIVFIDAGHGGLNSKGEYQTNGKMMLHKGEKMHDGKGNYFEGVENRIIANMFAAELKKLGIRYVMLHDEVQDTSLSIRSRTVRTYLNDACFGVMLSFHSNAIDLNNSKEKLDATRGFCVYTTRGQTFSDLVASQHYKHISQEFSKDQWNLRKEMIDGDEDYEADFQILRETDLKTDNIASILEEFGFHTSLPDTKFIMENRQRRVSCAVKTALWVQEQMLNF